MLAGCERREVVESGPISTCGYGRLLAAWDHTSSAACQEITLERPPRVEAHRKLLAPPSQVGHSRVIA